MHRGNLAGGVIPPNISPVDWLHIVGGDQTLYIADCRSEIGVGKRRSCETWVDDPPLLLRLHRAADGVA